MMKIYLARVELELVSPLHIGTGKESSVTDTPVYRDAFGDYRIPASSLAGVMRSAIARSAHGSIIADQLLGHAGTNDEGAGSRIALSDGYLLDFDGQPVLEKRLRGDSWEYPTLNVVQDCVRLDEVSGTAVDGGKFDLEVVPQGTRFMLELEYSPGSEGDLHHVLKQLLVSMQQGEVQIGGGTSRGFGHVRATNTSLHTFELDTLEGLACWIDCPRVMGQRISATVPTIRVEGEGLPPSAQADNISGRVQLRFSADGPLLVGGAQQGARGEDAADLTFVEMPVVDRSGQHPKISYLPVVPGTGLKGAIRHRVAHILASIGHESSQEVLGGMFGSIKSGEESGGIRSKIDVVGCTLPRTNYTLVQHVAIDRLTGGALRGALYSEAPIWADGLELEVSLVVRDFSDFEAGLLCHTLLDMGEGRLPIGGGTRRGNGRLRFSESPTGVGGKAVHFSLHRQGVHLDEKTSASVLNQVLESVSASFLQESGKESQS